MDEKIFLTILFLLLLVTPLVGYRLYKSREITNKFIAFFFSVSLGLIHFFVIMALNIFDEKSIIFGGFFIILYLVVGNTFGFWLLNKIRKK